MADKVDPLLEWIDRELVECDASSLPPLATGGLVSGEPAMLNDEPAPFVMPVDRESSPVAYVGLHEPPLIEPRADQMRGWLAGLFARKWFR